MCFLDKSCPNSEECLEHERHVCPHRTKEQLVLGTDQQSSKSVNVASRGDGKKQRKHWSTRNEKQTASLSSDQLNTTFIIEDSTNLASAITVDSKGNSQKSSVQNGGKYSSKQVPRTLPIRRPDNLRSEGESDFTTTHKHDFIEKSVDSLTIVSATTSSAAVKEESWNKRQIPKTQIIKKPDTLILSGPQNLETTHKAEFSETTSAYKSNASSQESSLIKETYQRPRTSLKVGGEFQSDSSYQSAFTAKQSEDGYKVIKGTSTASHLKSEGEMTFDQTSMDYNIVSSHVSRASENAGDVTILKPKIARPESEIKIPSVPLSDETTLVSDFKRWNVEKPTRHKPPDTLQIGGPEEDDSVSRRTDGKSHSSVETSHMETSMSDYKNWQVTRPVVSKPQNNLKPEGDFHFDTTHDSDYNSRRDTITISKRPSILEPLTERTETESVGPSSQDERVVTLAETEQTESHAKDTSRSVQINDTVTHIQEADVKDVVVASNNGTQTQGTSNASIGMELGEYEDHVVTTQNEEQEHYLSWDEIRPKPIRPHSNLRQEGGMEFSTTNRSEFVTRSMERVKGVRPQTSTKLFDGAFDAKTMNQVMFSNDQGEKVHPIRPKSNLHVEGGDFNGETTATREFQQWQINKPSPIIPKSNLAQEGTMDFTTTNQTEFEEKRLEKVFPIRPTATNQISGDIDLTTTNKVMHAEFPIERVKKIVPQSNLRMSSGAFVAETTNKSQFQEWDIDRPKPIRPIPNLSQEGSMDFTTMNKMQFEEKPIEKVSQFRPQTSSKITGDFDGVTMNQVMFGVQQSERPQMVRPKGNLQVEKGKFATDTTNLSEFQQWQHSKPDAVTPRNNLTQEGTIDFTTTSQVQYGAKQIDRVSEIRPKANSKITGEFDGTTTNQVMFQDSPREKLQAKRPHNNLQLETGNFTSETTNNTEFKQWQYSKPSLIKPHGSMKQEGDMDFTTTSDREFTGKIAEKVSPIRPTTTTKITGEFEGTTTNQAMFQNKQIEKVKGKRPTTNVHLEKGKFETETTASREFQQWEINRSVPIKPVGNLIQEGEMDFTTSNQTDFEGKQITKVERIRPSTTSPVTGDFDGTTTNNVMFLGQTPEKVHDIRPKDNLRVDSGQFNSETTTSRAFEGKTGAKPVPIKPVGNLIQEGEMYFTTSNQSDFEAKHITKVERMRPNATSLVTGDFDGTTTNNVMFLGQTPEKVHDIRPKDNLRVDSGQFNSETTTSRAFEGKTGAKPVPIKPVGNLIQEGEMYFKTSNQTDFEAKHITKAVERIRTNATSLVTGDFDGTTTNNVMFLGQTPEKVHDIRPKDNLRIDSGQFNSETTTSRAFEGKTGAKPVPIKPVGNLIQEGEMDFTTSNQTDFEAKHITKVEKIRPHTTSPVTGDFDGTTTNNVMFLGQTPEKVHDIRPKDNLRVDSGQFNSETTTSRAFEGKTGAKSVPIKPVGNLIQEGEMYFKTSNQTDFEAKHITKAVERIRTNATSLVTGDFDGTTTNNVMFLGQTPEKVHDIRPKDNLRIDSGQFNSETTTSRAFEGKTGAKSVPIKPVGNLIQEGEMYFKTSNQTDFEAKHITKAVERIRTNATSLVTGDFDGTTTNNVMFLGQTPEKVHDIRPKDNLRVDSGQFNSETTTSRAFEGKTGTKPVPIKPVGNLIQEGEMDFTTSNQTDFEAKHITKLEKIRPHTTSPVTGDFDGTTTNNVMFLGQTPEKVHDIRPKDNLRVDSGQFNSETTTSRAFEGKTGAKPVPIKPVGNLIQEGEMYFTTSNQSDFEAKHITKVERMRPNATSLVTGDFDGTTTNNVMFLGQTPEKVHDIRPKDNLRVDSGQFNSETTTSRAFEGKTGAKPVPIVPKSSLTQEGEFDFITSNQMQFEEKSINKVSQIRPKTQTKSEGGKFYSTTTNQATFPAPAMTTTRGIKPTDNLHVDSGEFQNNSTTSDEYQQWKVQKPTAFQLESSLKQEGEMQFETTNTTEFQHKGFDRVQPIRPKTTNKIEGDFESTTTNQVMFHGHENAERTKPIRQQNNLQLEKGKFSNETTNSREFRRWVKMDSKETESNQKTKAAGVPSLKPMSPKKKEAQKDIEKSVEANGRVVHEPWKLEKESVPHPNNKETVLSNDVSKIVVTDNTSIQNGTLQNAIRTNDAAHSLETSSESKSGQTIMQSNGMRKQSSLGIDVSDSNQKLTRDVSTVMTDYGTKQVIKVKSIIPSGNLTNSGDMTFITTSKTDYAQLENSQYKQKSRFSRSEETIGGILSPVKTVSSPQDNAHHKQKSRFSRSDEKIGGTLSPVRTDSAQQKASQYRQKSRFSRSEETIGGILSPVRIDSAQQDNSQYKQKSRCSRSDEKIGGGQGSPGRTDSEYRSWKLQQNEIIKKSGTSGRNESQILLQNDESQARGTKTGYASPTSPPKTPVSKPLKRFKPADNLKIESVPFEASSTTKSEFQKWETRRSSSKKRGESLKQEGDMQFDTTANDYALSVAYQASRESTKAKSKADQRGSLGQSGSMDFHTTSNSSYAANVTGAKSKMIRPRSSFKFGGDESAANDSISSTRSNPETTSQSYQGLTSTSQASYVGHTTSRRTRANRPSTSQKVGQGAFEGQTTSTSSFTAHHDRGEKSRAIRHENHNILNAESGFSGSTTYRNSFDATKGHHCPVLDLQASGSGFSFNEEKNGHVYYAPRVQG